MDVTDEMLDAFRQAWYTTAPINPGDRRRAGIEAVIALLTITVPDDMTLSDLLADMNFERGEEPVVVGFDANGRPFLAYGWAPGGDGWDTGVLFDDNHSSEYDINGVKRCDECGSFDRMPTSRLRFPISVMRIS